MTTIAKFQVVPEEEGLLEGFRNDGHTCSEKFAELIDNALDANAIEIKISYTSKQIRQNSSKTALTRIVIGDNGTGIVKYKIQEALQIGKRKENTKKIGKYGFGLKTACFGLGRTLTILTKTQKGDLEVFLWNLDDKTRKDFDIHQIEVTKEHSKIFSEHADDSGTVLMVENIYPAISQKILNPKDKTQSLEHDLSQIYHRKIEKEIVRLSVNKRVLKPSPIINGVLKTLVNTFLEVGSGKIKVRFVELDEVGPSESDRGAYVYLNDRLINVKPIQDKNLRFDHASFNHLRLEINIPNWESVSEEMGLKVNNQKNGIQLSGVIRDEIADLIYPAISDYRQKMQKTEDDSSAENDSTPSGGLRLIKKAGEAPGDDESSSKMNNSWNVLVEGLSLEVGSKMSARDQKDSLDGKNTNHYTVEPRLLNKFDTFKQLPEALKKADLVPFPIDNGTWVMVRPKLLYMNIPKLNSKKIKEFLVAESGMTALTSLSLKDITSEKKALNFCHYHGVVNEALNDTDLARTVEGMERLTKVSITLGKEQISLDGVQIETDAGYEGKHLNLMEAKMVTKDQMEDINLRQLILPHAHYESKLSNKNIKVRSWLFLWYRDSNVARFIPVDIDWRVGIYEFDIKNESCFKLV